MAWNCRRGPDRGLGLLRSRPGYEYLGRVVTTVAGESGAWRARSPRAEGKQVVTLGHGSLRRDLPWARCLKV